MKTMGHAAAPTSGSRVLDALIPLPDVRTQHDIMVHAPAAVVYQVAHDFDLESLWAVRAIFRLRAWLLGSHEPPHERTGLIAGMLRLGWGRLAEYPDRCFVGGGACQPWVADVVFTSIPPDRFAAFSEPGLVKIAWTIEAEATAPERTRFITETRAAATDEAARKRFRRYWRKFSIGIVMVRLLVLPAVKHKAEKLWREQRRRPVSLPST